MSTPATPVQPDDKAIARAVELTLETDGIAGQMNNANISNSSGIYAILNILPSATTTKTVLPDDIFNTENHEGLHEVALALMAGKVLFKSSSPPSPMFSYGNDDWRNVVCLMIYYGFVFPCSETSEWMIGGTSDVKKMVKGANGNKVAEGDPMFQDKLDVLMAIEESLSCQEMLYRLANSVIIKAGGTSSAADATAVAAAAMIKSGTWDPKQLKNVDPEQLISALIQARHPFRACVPHAKANEALAQMEAASAGKESSTVTPGTSGTSGTQDTPVAGGVPLV